MSGKRYRKEQRGDGGDERVTLAEEGEKAEVPLTRLGQSAVRLLHRSRRRPPPRGRRRPLGTRGATPGCN